MQFDPEEGPDLEHDKAEATRWAKWVLAQNALILDTETTGLGDEAEIVQIALLGVDGIEAFNSLVRPTDPRVLLQKGERGKSPYEIHGISPAMVEKAPGWETVWPQVNRIIKDRLVVIYNEAYDSARIQHCCRLHSQEAPSWKGTQCAMLAYAAWHGSWNPTHKSYKWQPLTGGDHSAMGDCRATLAVLQRMASYAPPTELKRWG